MALHSQLTARFDTERLDGLSVGRLSSSGVDEIHLPSPIDFPVSIPTESVRDELFNGFGPSSVDWCRFGRTSPPRPLVPSVIVCVSICVIDTSDSRSLRR